MDIDDIAYYLLMSILIAGICIILFMMTVALFPYSIAFWALVGVLFVSFVRKSRK